MTRDRARELLFPARMEKWLTLGFIAFLAGLGEGGGNYNFRWPGGGKMGGPFGSGGGGGGKSATPDPTPAEMLREAMTWVHEHLALVIVLGSVALLFGFGLGLVLTWLSSRGKLMSSTRAWAT